MVDIKSRKTSQSKKTQTKSTVTAEKKTASTKSASSKKKSGDNGNGSNKAKISQAQEHAIMNLSKRRGLSDEDLEKMSKEMFNSSVKDLSVSDASSFIQSLQQSA